MIQYQHLHILCTSSNPCVWYFPKRWPVKYQAPWQKQIHKYLYPQITIHTGNNKLTCVYLWKHLSVSWRTTGTVTTRMWDPLANYNTIERSAMFPRSCSRRHLLGNRLSSDSCAWQVHTSTFVSAGCERGYMKMEGVISRGLVWWWQRRQHRSTNG